MDKKKYVGADLEIIRLKIDDVIMASLPGDDGDELPGEDP